jgi:hypothetical protein
MVLHCPFCNANEDGRLEALDEKGEDIVLVMFKCPFHFRFPRRLITSETGDADAQKLLQDWKLEEGESWLDSIGPVLRQKERRNMQRLQSSSAQTPLED